jgi:hypothetical protein
LLFIDFEAARRIRVNGFASVDDADPMLSQYPAADLLVRVRADEIFPNCPRYIHTMKITDMSEYAPRPDYEPPEPVWKQMDAFREYLPSDPHP